MAGVAVSSWAMLHLNCVDKFAAARVTLSSYTFGTKHAILEAKCCLSEIVHSVEGAGKSTYRQKHYDLFFARRPPSRCPCYTLPTILSQVAAAAFFVRSNASFLSGERGWRVIFETSLMPPWNWVRMGRPSAVARYDR